MTPHIKRRDLPRTAWIQALAFATTATHADGTPKHHNPQPRTLAAWPGCLVTQAVRGHRNLYFTPSRQGVVAMHHNPAWGILARTFACPLPGLAASANMQRHPEDPTAYALTAAVLTVYFAALVSLVIAVSFSQNRPHAPKGTPKLPIPRHHVTFGLAAAHPDAPRGEAFGLVRELTQALPPGTTVIAHPRTPKLRQRYERAGYHPSKGLAMVKTTPQEHSA